jgi:hypothetical protein
MTPDTKEAYEKLLEAKVREWGSRVELLRAKIATERAEVGVALREKLDELKRLHASGKAHLADLRASGATSWEHARTALQTKWDELSLAAEELWKNVKM